MVDKVIIPLEIKETGKGLAQATEQATRLRDALKDAADMSAKVRVPLATGAARQGVAARAAAAQPGGGASDTNLSRGVAGATGASGRDFAAQAQGLGGLVHVYATFAANLYAVSAAFGALSKAADTANIIKGLEQLGAASGRSLGALAKQMAAASDGAISLRQAMTSTAMATAGGMSSDAILRMTEVAKKASLALGRDMTDSMDRLTKGIVKIQPELLDELGIMARVIPSQQAYARELGKSVEALSDFEKRQAFANAVLKEGETKFGNIEIAANSYAKLSASLANLATEGLNAINVVLLPIAKILAESPTGLALAVATVAGILLKQAIPALGQYKRGIEEMQKLSLAKAIDKKDILGDMGYYDNTQAEKAKEAYKRTNQYAAASAQDRAKIDIEAEKVYNNTLTRRAESAKFFASHEASNTRIVSRAMTEAANANLKADVAQTQSKYGMIAAYRRLNEEINTATSSKRIVELGDGVQGVAPKMNALEGGFRKFAGTLAIAGAAAMTLMESLAPILLAVGLFLTVFSMWWDYMKTASKETEKFNGSVDLLNDGVKTVTNTIDAINRKPFLEQMSIESMEAKANALSNIGDTLKKVSKDAVDASKKMNMFDRLSDIRLWSAMNVPIIDLGKTKVDVSEIAKKLSDSLSAGIVAAAKDVEGGPGEAQLKEAMVKILGASYTDIADLEKRLSTVGDGLIDKKDYIVSSIEAIGKKSQEVAGSARSLQTAWGSAGKTWDSIVASLAVKDPLGKLGQEAMEIGIEMSKAFKEAESAQRSLLKLSQTPSQLRMLSPETQKQLLEFSYKAEAAQERVKKLNAQLEIQQKIATDARKNIGLDTSVSGRYGQQGAGPGAAGAQSAALNAANKSVEAADKQIEAIKKRIEFEKQNLNDQGLYLRAQDEVFAKGALQIENSIGLGFQKSGIELQLRALSGNNTTEGIRQSVRLQEALLQVQVGGITAQQDLITATNNLARITEEVAIEEKMKQVKAPGFTGDRDAEMKNLQARSAANQMYPMLRKLDDAALRSMAIGTNNNVKGKTANIAPTDLTPEQRAVALSAFTERQSQKQGDLDKAVIANTIIGNKLQEQKDLAVAIQEAKRGGLEATIAQASAQQSILSSLEKYAPIITDTALQTKISLDNSIRQNQQELTRLNLVGKIKAEEAALAFMKANPKSYKKDTVVSQEAAVAQAKAALSAQERKNIAENSVAAQAAADYRLNAAKKNFDYEASIRKQQNEWNNEELQNTINLSSIKLETLTGMKALQESVTSDQQRKIEFDKEEADFATKIASARESNLAKEFDLKQKMSQFGTGTEEYNKLLTQLDAETEHYKKQKIALEQLHNAKNKQIGDMAAYKKALAEINEAEEKAARIRATAESNTTIAQLNQSTFANTKAFLDEEIIARQKLIDLDKEQNSYVKEKAALQKKYDEQVAGVNIALESKPADKELLDRLKELKEALKTDEQNLINVRIATEANIDATSRYSRALAELTQTQALAQGERAVRAGSLANKESLGTISAGTAAIDRSGMAKQAADDQYAKDTLGVQEKITELQEKGFAARTVQEDFDLAAYQNKLSFYDKQLGYQKQVIDNDTATSMQLAINNLQLEEQARLTATASAYTEDMTTAFGELGTAIGSATEALVKMANDEITYIKDKAKLEDQLKEVVNDDEKLLLTKKLGALEAKNSADQISNISKLAGASKKFFDQKTMGYKVMQGIEKASALVSSAIQAQQLAASASAALKQIGINIPAIYTEFMKWMGPWGPPAAAAALAAVGVAASAPSTTGSMVDMTGQTSEERQKTQGTGGVFGDEEAKTTTIVSALELLAANSIEGLNYDNELLKAMRRVADSVTGAAKSIYASPGIRSGRGFGTEESVKSIAGGFASAPVIGKVLDSIFGGGSSTTNKITSAGLQLQGTFKDVINLTTGSILQFKDVLTTTKTDGGWFGSDSESSSLSRQTQELGSTTSQAIADIFGQANGMFLELGKKTNVSATDIQNTLDTFDVSMPIDLMNKTGQELVDELNAVIGEKISGAAQRIFTGFEKYREFGEDYLGTVLRVVDGNDKVNQSLLSIGHAFSVVGRFDITESLIKAAGGLEEFQNQALFFQSNFLSAAEKLAPVQKGVTDQLTKLGISTAITRDQYKTLVISQDLSTSSGREMYQSLMELAPGFDIVTKGLDELANKSLDLEAKIYELIGQKSAALAIARNKELAAMDASLRPRQIYINALTDEIAIRDRLKSAYDSSNKSVNTAIDSLNKYKTALLAGAASTLTPAQKYADATAIFKATAQAAAVKITTSSTAADIATRDEAVAKLSNVSDSFLANSKEMNAGTAQYATDLALVTTAVTDATNEMGNQLSDSKLQLGFLDTIAAATQTTADILTEYLAAQGVTNIAQTTSAASGSVASTFQIPGHAEGGLAQGISIVGENGPEIVDFKNPGRVYSNQASNELFSTKELVEEIKALRKEVADLRSDQQEQTGHLITSTYDANMKNAEAITTGNQAALNNQNWSTRSKVKVA